MLPACRVPLVEALCGTAVHLQTLDGRPLTVPINTPISLQQVGWGCRFGCFAQWRCSTCLVTGHWVIGHGRLCACLLGSLSANRCARMPLLACVGGCCPSSQTALLNVPGQPCDCRMWWCLGRACPSPSSLARRATCAYGERQLWRRAIDGSVSSPAAAPSHCHSCFCYHSAVATCLLPPQLRLLS